MTRSGTSRRGFIKAVSVTALGVSFTASLPIARALAQSTGDVAGDGPNLLSWVTIHRDNSATVIVPQTELGQGVATTIPQVIADELGLDWARVIPAFYDPRVNADRDNVYVWTATLGSMSAHYLYEPARQAAAQIRMLLIDAASDRLGIPATALNAAASHVRHAPTGRSISYAALAPAAAKLPVPERPILKRATDQTLIGKPIGQFGLDAIMHGAKQFGIDIELPGMRFAAILQSPVLGGRVVRFDSATLAGRPGHPTAYRVEHGLVGYNSPVPEGEDPELWATAVTTDDAVAVVADTWWHAKTALEALPVEWSESVHRRFSSKALSQALADKVNEALPLVAETGDFDAALALCAQELSAVYRYPYMEQAPLEPMNCTALVDDSSVHVWTNTQFADDAWRIAYEVGGVPPEQAHVHLVPAGGGFGRRLQNDFVFQAVQIARQTPGTPVKLLWTREESTRHSYYAPLTVARFDGGVDALGSLIAWRCRVASGTSADQAYGATRIPFQVPNARFEYQRDQSTPVPFGFMRGVGFTQHVWMNFSFLDEVRLLSGRDPIDFLRTLIDHTAIPSNSDNYDLAVARARRHQRVLEFVARQWAWNAPKPKGTGRGLAITDSDYYPGYGSSTKAAIVDVSLAESGEPRVERVFIAIDAGTIINPDIVHAQLEGGVAYALTTALMSEITVESGQVQQSNFHDYPILTMDRMPPVEIAILPSDDTPEGVGEDAVPITIAALVNAIADAGGPRVRNLPIRIDTCSPERSKACTTNRGEST